MQQRIDLEHVPRQRCKTKKYKVLLSSLEIGNKRYSNKAKAQTTMVVGIKGQLKKKLGETRANCGFSVGKEARASARRASKGVRHGSALHRDDQQSRTGPLSFSFSFSFLSSSTEEMGCACVGVRK